MVGGIIVLGCVVIFHLLMKMIYSRSPRRRSES